MSEEVTLGEVHRLCVEIRKDVKSQNGRVNALEKDVIRIKTIWASAVVILGFFGDYIRHKIGLQ